MKINIKNTFRTGAMAMAGLLAFTACSDTWDEHYNGTIDQGYAGSMMEYLVDPANGVNDFADVVKAAGYDSELNASQVLTILAPQNGTFNKDSLLQLISNGKRQLVIDRFIKNHVMRYNISLGAKEQDLTLLNTKKVKLGTLADKKVNDANVVNENVACKNGVIQVLDASIPFMPNIYEYLHDEFEAYKEANGLTDVPDDEIISLFSFLKKYDDDLLDEARSVKSGQTDPNTREPIYIDSVMIRNNTVATRLDAYIFREDSNYVAILPSTEAYQKRFNELREYFKYNYSMDSKEEKRDSIQTYMTHLAVISDLFYNMNMNQHPEDSLFSTDYSRNSWQYDVYYNPYEADGLLGNYTKKVECSNGAVYLMDEFPYSIYDNTFRRIIVEGESTYSIENGADAAAKKWTENEAYDTRAWTENDSVSKGMFLHAYSSPSNQQLKLGYKLPGTLSGTYDVYIKTVPLSYYYKLIADEEDPSLPARFRIRLFERDEKGQLSATSPTVNFVNPETDTEHFQTNPAGVEKLKIGEVTFQNCFRGDDYGALLQIETSASASQVRQGKFVRDICLDCIILEPHREGVEPEETEEPESEEATEVRRRLTNKF